MTYYTDRKEFKLLWNYNFYNGVVTFIMLGVATAGFARAYNRIKRLGNILNSPKNNAVLAGYKIIAGLCLLSFILLDAVCFLGLLSQGYYGPMAVFQAIACSSLMIISEIGIFVMVIQYNLEMTLKTQVLANGCIVLVGYDRDASELIKLYIHRGGNEEDHESNQVSNDGFTDNGCVTPSAVSQMSINLDGSIFVPEFEGASNAAPQGVINHFSINADVRPSSPVIPALSNLNSSDHDD